MSISSELLQLNSNKANIKTAIESKNPSIAPTDNLSQWPVSIESIAPRKEEQSKTVTPSTNETTVLPDSGKALSSVVVNGDPDLVSSNIKSGVSIFGVNGNVVELNGETKTVDPTTSQQTITPSSGKNAITQVTVNPVTSEIDNSIQQNNIKSGVSILGVDGNVVELKGETRTVSPSTTQQIITPSSGKNAITQVTVNAIETDNITISPNVSDITISPNVYLATKVSNGIYFSPDGATWSRTNQTSGSFRDIIFDGDKYLAVDTTTGTGSIYYSTDKIKWTKIPGSPNGWCIFHHCNLYLVGCNNNGIYYSTDGTTWNPTNQTTNAVYCIIYNDGKYLAACGNGIYYSTDGTTWNPTNQTDGIFYVILHKNNKYIAGSSDGIYHSSDGMTWSQTNQTTGTFRDIIFDGEKYLACSTKITTGGIFYSIDGITWNITHSGVFRSIIFGNGIYYSCSNNGIFYSDDGLTWTKNEQTSGSFWDISYQKSEKIYSTIVVSGVTSSIDSNIQESNIKSGVTILGVTGNVLSAKEEQSKTVTPTAAGLTVTPDSGKTLSSVVVNGDADLVASNIKKNVEIFGVTGSYEGSGGGGGTTGYNVEIHPSLDQNNNVEYSFSVVCYKTDGSEVTINTEGSCSDVEYVKVIPLNKGNDYTISISGQTELSNCLDDGIYYIKLLSNTVFQGHFYGCLLKGTKLLLGNGSEKNIEDIQYNDELLVWDFDNGCLSSSKPLWIKKKENCGYYFVNKYKSGKELLTTGQSSTGWGHRTFDLNKNKFIYTTESVSDNIYTLDGADIHMSCSRIEENCEFYNIITEKHFNLFANRILTSCSLNNLYPIKDMKYLKDNRGLRSFEEYSGITKEYFDGLRLSENNSDISQINSYVQKLLNNRI